MKIVIIRVMEWAKEKGNDEGTRRIGKRRGENDDEEEEEGVC